MKGGTGWNSLQWTHAIGREHRPREDVPLLWVQRGDALPDGELCGAMDAKVRLERCGGRASQLQLAHHAHFVTVLSKFCAST